MGLVRQDACPWKAKPLKISAIDILTTLYFLCNLLMGLVSQLECLSLKAFQAFSQHLIFFVTYEWA